MAFRLGQPMQLLGCPRDLIYMPTVWNGWNIVDKTMSLKPSLFSLLTKQLAINPAAPVTIIILLSYKLFN